MAHAIHPYSRAATRWSGNTFLVGPASSPVAHISFSSSQHDVVRGETHFPLTQQFPCGRVELSQLVGEIEHDIELGAVSREREPRRDLRLPPFGFGHWNREQTAHFTAPVHPEYLYGSVDVGQVDAPAIRRKNQAGETELRSIVRLENGRGDRLGGRVGDFPASARQAP